MMKKLLVAACIVMCINSSISNTSFGQTGWVEINTQLHSDFSGIFFVNNQTGYAGSYWTQIDKTTNGGLNWFNIIPYWFHRKISLFFINDLTGFFTCANPAVYKTINGGLNWETISMDSDYISDITFINNETGFASGEGIYKTTNQGLNWVPVLQNLNNFHIVTFPSSDTGYVVGNGSRNSFLWKTTNSGNIWFDTKVNFDSTDVYQTFFVNSQLGFVSGRNSYYSKGHFLKTTDGGYNWSEPHFDIPDNLYSSVFFIDTKTGYVTGNRKIYKTTNSGETFFNIYSRTNGELNDIKFIGKDTGFVAGNYNSVGFILKTTNGGNVFISQISSEVPENFSLKQNYPNPFNPSTRINYDIKKSGFVALRIFNAAGKKISELVNERQTAGSYSVDFNSGEYNLPSGIYFYTLQSGDFKETRKMILVK